MSDPQAASRATPSVSQRLAGWASATAFEDIPPDVIAATRLRILDTIGLALAGQTFDVGRAALAACSGIGEVGRATILGGPANVPATTAALANGTLAEAIEFDDSHNATVVHVSSPVVAAALACAQEAESTGAQLVRAIALASEITCRIAVAQPGAFHPLGFHPTGIFGAFGSATAASLLLGLDADRLGHALGIVGSFAAGSLESWSDGTWGKLINPGWAAQSGIWASRLAASGYSGPRAILEGKFGLFATHVQHASSPPDLDRIVHGLGAEWESRNISFKPYPNAHVMHGVLDAAQALVNTGAVRSKDIVSVHCLVAPYMVPLICEPMEERRRPGSSAQARLSLPHSIAELLQARRMDVGSYSEAALENEATQSLADKVSYSVVADWTGRDAYPGGVQITLRDGRVLEQIERANLGSAAKPMSRADVEEKFRSNASLVLSSSRTEEIVGLAREIDRADQISRLIALCAAR